MLAVVDPVAAQAWVGTSTNADAGDALAVDVAILQLEAPLGNVHAVPAPISHLSQAVVLINAEVLFP